MSAPRQNDYIYASARIGVLENAILTKEQYDKLIFAPAGMERQMLISFGYPKMEKAPLSEMLEKRVKEAFDTVCETVSDGSAFDALRYPYDCMNLKAVIKCSLRTGFRAEEFLSDIGTVPPEKAAQALREGDFSPYPSHMAGAAAQVTEAYPKTSDPSIIDAALDRACFLDMKAAAQASGIPELSEYVTRKIDVVNTVMCARLIENTGNRSEDVFLAGGSISREKLSACLAAGSFTKEVFRDTLLEAVTEEILSAESPAALERVLDLFEMKQIVPHQNAYFGAARLIGYLLAYEAEVKNLRIILAGRIAGDAGEKMRERLRVIYV